MKTLLIGNFGSGNIGDELILSQALEKHPEVVVMTVNGEFSQEFCGRKLETIPFPPTGLRSGLHYLFSAGYRRELNSIVGKVDKVVFPGGGLFAIKFRACLLWFLVFVWARKLKCPIEFTHQGVDESLGIFSRILTRFVLSRSDKITVRDEVSVRSVRNLCGKNVENRGDLVQEIKTEVSSPKEKLILVNARSKFALDNLNKRFGDYKKIFVAFDKTDQKFASNLEVIYPQTRREVLDLFRKAEYVVGERLHFLILGEIFCGSDKTFVLQEPYAEKVQSFCSDKGIRNYLSSVK